MPDNPFAAVLTEELEKKEQAQQSLKILRDFCDGIELSTGRQVDCKLERGYRVEYGQEWRPVLRSLLGGPPNLLFRAYVPERDWPVMLDLREGALTQVNGPDELTSILQNFLRNPNVIEQIRYVMAFPRPPQTV